ncbi:hypothetical protein [Streptomyces echinatus]|uniref:hypothetical protein n=1 Tax=Streptomyces echinatus TaxID=67293 RepID=UPI0038083CA5
MDTYAVRDARSKMTGHYRRPGTRDLHCGRLVGTKNGQGAALRGWKMCTRCVKAEVADRAEAWLDQPPASPLAAEQAEAAGTWRAEWISTAPPRPHPVFDVEPESEQGALFA